MEIFRYNVTFFFFGLFSLVSLTELCLFWYGLKDLFTLHKLADKVVLSRPLKLMMSQVVEGMQMHMGRTKRMHHRCVHTKMVHSLRS